MGESHIGFVLGLILWSSNAALWMSLITSAVLVLIWSNSGGVNRMFKMVFITQMVLSVLALVAQYITD